MVDKRVRRRGVLFTPKASQVAEIRHFIREGLPIHPRWLPFMTPAQRRKAIVRKP